MAKILVVDDSRLGRTFVSLPLIKQGHEVTEAIHGVDGLEKLHHHDFDLVITDLLMPEMNGEQFLRQIRQEGNSIPVIIVSADIQESTHQRCKELGMEQFFNKPINAEKLLDAVEASLITSVPQTTESEYSLLSEQQLDALTEIVNIGIGRAASSLSTLMGQRVELTIPRLTMESINHYKASSPESGAPDTSVVQDFTGQLSGRALLAFPESSSLKLAQVLGGMESRPNELDVDLRGIVNEVGNIVLNGVLGSLSNLFRDHFQYSVPQLYVNQCSYQVLLNTLQEEHHNEHLVLAADAHFNIAESNIHGSLVVLFTIGDIGPMLDAFIDQPILASQ